MQHLGLYARPERLQRYALAQLVHDPRCVEASILVLLFYQLGKYRELDGADMRASGYSGSQCLEELHMTTVCGVPASCIPEVDPVLDVQVDPDSWQDLPGDFEIECVHHRC